MKRNIYALSIAVLAVPALYAGCGDDETTTPGPSGQCNPTDPACPALAVQSECLGLSDNSGKDVFALRLAQLTLTAPQALTEQLVQSFIGDGVWLNLPACLLPGKGTFSLIVEFDRAQGRARAGSAYPEADPSGGYCYVYDAANAIAPIDIAVSIDENGRFNTDPIPQVTLPVFDTLEGTDAVLLPLRQVVLNEATLSGDQNCIGEYNADGLDPRFDCNPDPQFGQPLYIDGGTLQGHIRLDEADGVDVDVLGQSLCVLLSGDANAFGDGGTPINRCRREGGNIALTGDWCSETDSPGGCMDSFRLVATFAAASVTLRSDCPQDG